MNHVLRSLGYRSPADRKEQADARLRIVEARPEMADLPESRVGWSYFMRASMHLAGAIAWVFGAHFLWSLSGPMDAGTWKPILLLVIAILCLSVGTGNMIKGLVALGRSFFTRFNWVEYEILLGLRDRTSPPDGDSVAR